MAYSEFWLLDSGFPGQPVREGCFVGGQSGDGLAVFLLLVDGWGRVGQPGSSRRGELSRQKGGGARAHALA